MQPFYYGCSDKACKWLYGKNKDKAIIIKNGIETEKFCFNENIRKKKREELGIKECEFIIGHVGRFCVAKNHEYLIKIFNEYNKINNNSKLILIGDGELREKITKEIKKLHLEKKVLILGFRNDTNELLQAMDCFVFPSIYEGLPLSLIEAQAANLMILASNKITKMTDITGNIKFLDINQNSIEWAKRIPIKPLERFNQKLKIKEAGYDIKAICQELEKIYLK